ncbi:uncharacterized protein LOC107981885 [Nasonia vitripennis]|uniref:Uncharacterized protein n=1 Tax=Nasonia vitripennis TaxID=7425 RepID=A0A7M7J147_NASVI|nr:uncharacterized protein LOC107981885 [Nasonia vitripennis]
MSEKRYKFLVSPKIGRQNWILWGNPNIRCNKTITFKNSYLSLPHCSVFEYCTCEDPADDIDRHFNLRPVTSDVANNKIVTGVKIVKDQNLFHIQIKQGELSNGFVNTSSIAWKPLEKYSPLDIGYERGVDFYTVESRSKTVCLDDLDANKSANKSNYLLTGLRFAVGPRTVFLRGKFNWDLERYLKLEIQLTPYDPETGYLIAENSTWISNINKPAKYSNGPFDWMDAEYDNYYITNRCIRISRSEDSLDFGQATVPLIDIQEITTDPVIPLSGAGLYYKSKQLYSHNDVKYELLRYGGYFGLRLFTHDISEIYT